MNLSFDVLPVGEENTEEFFTKQKYNFKFSSLVVIIVMYVK